MPTVLALLCGIGASVVANPAAATTYRCTIDGKVSYSDTPCASGAQATLAQEAAVDPVERAAAAARLRRDKADLAQLDRDREGEHEQELRALAAAQKRDTRVARDARTCTKLARRARDAHDAFDLARPLDQAKMRLRMQRADQDFAALCKKSSTSRLDSGQDVASSWHRR